MRDNAFCKYILLLVQHTQHVYVKVASRVDPIIENDVHRFATATGYHRQVNADVTQVDVATKNLSSAHTALPPPPQRLANHQTIPHTQPQ